MMGEWGRSAAPQGKFSHLILRVGLFCLPVLIYLPALAGSVPFPPGENTFSDLLITHYPNLVFLRETLIHHNQLPLWNPTIFSGAPFAANPLSGLFYLPGWLAMLWPLPAGLSLTAAVHSVFGTWGMYKFLQRLGHQEWGCILGALGFGMMPKLAAHLGAGHITLLYALAWTPWLFVASSNDQRGWLTGAAAGMLFLADPRWAVYAGLLWLTFEIAHRHFGEGKGWIFYLKAAITAFLVASPLILPLMEYIPRTTRAGMEARDILTLGLPPSQFLGLVLPISGGNPEWYLYPGAVFLLLAASQLVVPVQRKRNLFWNLWAAASLILALGLWGNFSTWLETIPGFSLLRVPARSLFITGFCYSVLTSSTVGALIEQMGKYQPLKLIGFSAMAVSPALAIGIHKAAPEAEWQVYWGLLFLFLAGLYLFMHTWISTHQAALWILAGLVIIDLVGSGWMAYQVKSSYSRIEQDILAVLTADRDNFRVYSPSYSLATHEAVLHNLETADGVDPLQLSSYANFLSRASGVPLSGYSVTLPAFKSGDPDTDNHQAVPDAGMLGLLTVKYIAAEFPLQAEGLAFNRESNGQYLYVNEFQMPPAWVEDGESESLEIDLGSVNPAAIIDKSPNRIVLRAEGPGKLVLSEVYYPGWNAIVDGKAAKIDQRHGILRGVSLPAGSHIIEFVFKPASVYCGLGLSAAGWLLVFIYFIRKRFESVSR